MGSCTTPDHRDAILLARVADRDHEAFAALFDQLAPTALGLLVRILGSRSLGEEVLQEVFLQVWKQAPLYRPELRSVRGWLLEIARARGVERLRQERAAGSRIDVIRPSPLYTEEPPAAPKSREVDAPEGFDERLPPSHGARPRSYASHER